MLIRFLIPILGLVFLASTSYGQVINFYWNGTGPITTNSSWGTNLDGTGTSPINFTTVNQRFNIQNGQTATPTTLWTISGTNSGLTIQTGGQLNSNFNHNLTLSMQDGAIYSQTGTYSNLSLSSIDSGSTFVLNSGTFLPLAYGGFRWNVSTVQTININSSFSGNFQQSGSAELRLAASAINVGRDLLVDATRTLTFTTSSSTYALNLAGNYINSGSVTKSGTGTMNVNFSASAASATFGTFGVVNGNLNFNVASGNTLTVLDTMANPANARIVNNGTVNLGTGGPAGGINGGMVNNGLVVFNSSGNSTSVGVISGTGNLQHNGSGRTSLEGNNTYTGTTTVNNGALAINGAHFNAGLYTINPGGRLEGSGGINGNVNVAGGTIAPGNGAGMITINGNITFSSTSTYAVDVNGTLAGSGGYDQITIGSQGTMTLNNANLLVTLSIAPSVNNIFFIIQNLGTNPISGTFNNLPEGASIAIGNYVGNITYLANFSSTPPSITGGFDVAIYNLTASVPEPGSIALMGLVGFGALQWYLRKQKKQPVITTEEGSGERAEALLTESVE